MTSSATPPVIDHVAIIGAGFSGTLAAINLLRHDGPRVSLIERRGVIGRGIAYSTPNADHLLNVRAGNMSALPDDPDHFVRWLAARGRGGPASFASRQDYGDYLQGLLEATAADRPGRLRLYEDSAVEIAMRPDGVDLTLDGGRRLSADAVILSLGNLPPHDPPGFATATLPPDLYTGDPWGPRIAEGLTDDDTVLIVGTGLTMVDAVLTLDGAGFGGRIVAISRRGLMPRTHGDPSMARSTLGEKPAMAGAGLLRFVRDRARSLGWRAAIDELRPYTQAMWLAAPVDEQRRFLRHLRAWWDVHRHRLAPSVAARIEDLRNSGRLSIIAGKIGRVDEEDGRVTIDYRPRHATQSRQLIVRRALNCTGPQGDLLRTREPFLHLLLAGGLIRPDAHRFGLDVTAQSETIDVQGNSNPRLLALGPMTRGTFWEIVAVPDIRMQAWSVARRLSHAQWVGGEL